VVTIIFYNVDYHLFGRIMHSNDPVNVLWGECIRGVHFRGWCPLSDTRPGAWKGASETPIKGLGGACTGASPKSLGGRGHVYPGTCAFGNSLKKQTL